MSAAHRLEGRASLPPMNRDFVEMLSALSDAGAEFLVVGAHAVAVHGRLRATGWPTSPPSSRDVGDPYSALSASVG